MSTKNGSKKSNVMDFASIIEAGKPKLNKVHIEELGGDIYLKGMSALDVIEFASARGQEGDTDNHRQHEAMATLIAKSVTDEDGCPIFDTGDKIEELKRLNFKVYTALATAVTKNAGLVTDEEKGAEPGKG